MGDLPSLLAALKASPFLLFPAKFAIAYPLTYHYLGGVRHIVWDHHSIGNQVRGAAVPSTIQMKKANCEIQEKSFLNPCPLLHTIDLVRQADETSLLEKDRVEDQSKKMMLGAVGLSVLLSLL